MKNLKEFRSWKKCFQIFPFWVFSHRKNDTFSTFCAFSKSMTLNYEFYHAWNFEIKRKNVSLFEKKNVRNVSEFKKLTFEKRVLKYVTTWNDMICIFRAFRKAKLEVRKCTMVRFWEKPIQLVRYWMKRLETCQNLKKSAWEKRRYESCYSEKMAFFAFSPFFEKQDFENFQSIRVLTKLF